MSICLTFIPAMQGGWRRDLPALRGLAWLKIRVWRWIVGGGAGRGKFSLGIVWLAWLLPWSHCFCLSDPAKITEMICWEWESEAFSPIFQMLPLFCWVFLNASGLTQTTNRNLSLPRFSLSPRCVIYAERVLEETGGKGEFHIYFGFSSLVTGSLGPEKLLLVWVRQWGLRESQKNPPNPFPLPLSNKWIASFIEPGWYIKLIWANSPLRQLRGISEFSFL